MAQRWSVWDPTRACYAVYEGGAARDPAVPPVLPASVPGRLGDVPDDLTPVLPAGVRYVGESPTPAGRIAKRGGSGWLLAAIVAAAGYWAYRRWRRR